MNIKNSIISNKIFGKNIDYLSLKNPSNEFIKNKILNQYSNLINESIILSQKEIHPEKQLIEFFLHRAKKIYKISKHKKIGKNSQTYQRLLKNDNRSEVSQIIKILKDGIKKNIFINCDTNLTGKAMLNTIKGFDFLIYQGKSFAELNEEIHEILRILVNSIKK